MLTYSKSFTHSHSLTHSKSHSLIHSLTHSLFISVGISEVKLFMPTLKRQESLELLSLVLVVQRLVLPSYYMLPLVLPACVTVLNLFV